MRDIESKKKHRGTAPGGPRLRHYILLGTLFIVAAVVVGFSLLQ